MKKRILFVEDNPMLLQMYGMMLARDNESWEVAMADDGQQALTQMEKSVPDVVLSDMRMPGMSGVELLAEVKKTYPQTSRIIVSGIGDQEEVARSLEDTHQFLAKPFDVKTLKATLGRISGLDAYLKDDNLKTLVGRLGALPSFPTLYMEVMKELESPNCSVESLAEIVRRDPGMTVKMLQIANSAAIGLATKTNSSFEAIQQLGMNSVRSLAISAHVFSCFERSPLKGFSIEELWRHLMNTAQLARRIMQLEGAEAPDAEDAYLAGMLHDIGKLMLANSLSTPFQNALTLAAERSIPLQEAETEVFGATHAGVAAYLLGLWGLPATIVEAVAFHHAPEKSPMQEFTALTAVHVANALEHEMTKTNSSGLRPELDMKYLGSLGVAERVEVWRAEALKLSERDE